MVYPRRRSGDLAISPEVVIPIDRSFDIWQEKSKSRHGQDHMAARQPACRYASTALTARDMAEGSKILSGMPLCLPYKSGFTMEGDATRGGG